jgi:shikimate kinase
MREGGEVYIEIRRPWSHGLNLFLVGPGGVGKSTLGAELAGLLGLPLVDLDHAFCDALGEIGRFIGREGYDRYRAENLGLAESIVRATGAPILLVTSSGFLAAATGSEDRQQAQALVEGGYSVTLLPSLDIEVATSVVVERQLKRGFGLERAGEERKFRERFGIYRHVGDALVVSVAEPAETARSLVGALRQSEESLPVMR